MRSQSSHPPVPRWRRQDIFRKKWFQTRIILSYIALLLGGAAGLSYYLYRYSYARIRFEMFKGHSAVASPWEVLRNGIFTANAVATAVVIFLAIVITVLITRSVSTAARRLTDNLRSAAKGVGPRDWAPPPGIYEFQHLHRLLAEAVETHTERVGEIRTLSVMLRERVQALRKRVELEGAQRSASSLREMHVQCEKLKSSFEKLALKAE